MPKHARTLLIAVLVTTVTASVGAAVIRHGQSTSASRSCAITRSQVELVRTFYEPTVNPRTKASVYPGYAKNGHMVAKFRFGNDAPFFKYALFQDPIRRSAVV
jgi:hypothetical protein